MASAGIGPSPFKVYLAETVERIIERIRELETAGTNGDITPTITRLQAIADPARNVTNVVIEKNTLGAMDRITAVLFAPQPEPPKIPFDALVILINDLITLGFETPPDMISLATESSQLLDRFTARLFAPQPEPPRVGTVELGLNIVSKISQLTLGATPEDRDTAKRVVGILDKIEAVLFAPQPEPPKLARPLSDILIDMSKLYFEVNQGAN